MARPGNSFADTGEKVLEKDGEDRQYRARLEGPPNNEHAALVSPDVRSMLRQSTSGSAQTSDESDEWSGTELPGDGSCGMRSSFACRKKLRACVAPPLTQTHETGIFRAVSV
jgi:hypothetical protein